MNSFTLDFFFNLGAALSLFLLIFSCKVFYFSLYANILYVPIYIANSYANIHLIRLYVLLFLDCSVPQVVVFGERLSLDIPPEAATLEYSPSSSPDTKEVLWPSSNSTVSKGYRHGDTWRKQSTSKADSGFYTFRKQSGVEVSKINVIVTGKKRGLGEL